MIQPNQKNIFQRSNNNTDYISDYKTGYITWAEASREAINKGKKNNRKMTCTTVLFSQGLVLNILKQKDQRFLNKRTAQHFRN